MRYLSVSTSHSLSPRNESQVQPVVRAGAVVEVVRRNRIERITKPQVEVEADDIGVHQPAEIAERDERKAVESCKRSRHWGFVGMRF
jgi:hypothetical protein